MKTENDLAYEEEYAIKLFKRTIKRSSNGRYDAQPLFKKDCVPLKNNYYASMLRFETLRRTLWKNANKANT